MPSNEQHRGDEAEDEDRRTDRGKLEVLALVVPVPPLQAFDQPERRDDHGPIVMYCTENGSGRERSWRLRDANARKQKTICPDAGPKYG